MSWILLIRRFEVGFALFGKANEKKDWIYLLDVGLLLCLSISMLLLYKATQELPIGTAYVWTGIELWDRFSGYRCI
jgi:quaternary ammonium compound-resistance protein SugE